MTRGVTLENVDPLAPPFSRHLSLVLHFANEMEKQARNLILSFAKNKGRTPPLLRSPEL